VATEPAPAVRDGLARWKALLERRDMAALDDLLAEDAVFYSPVVFRPQQGREITALYLRAADQVLNTGAFRYIGEWTSETGAVLEFETRIGEATVNGVDMITFDETGRITEFKVMVRPWRAIEALRQAMQDMLEALGPRG